MCICKTVNGSLQAVGAICGKEECKIREDCLSISTQYVRRISSSLDARYKNLRKSKYWRLFSNTTQPAHFVTMLAVATISCLMMPNSTESQKNSSPLLNLLYLASVSAHFGIQLWMSFVSGLALYFTLPRRIFGKVQRILFPKYFLVNSILSLISLCIFLRKHNGRLLVPQIRLQVEALLLCFFLELIIRLYLTPPLLHFLQKATEYEEEVGVGMEVGRHKSGVLARNKNYVLVYTSFRKLHMAIAIGNIITLACSVVHIYYIANIIQFT
ncbi:transmembrane protein 205 [Photinus pyralis]|uniref:transmembrane protein 205 n=1 Tax=Photinus pyralis TaxID=7054 RepID=UPI001266E736|nr:transmembrane protein 205 [Photinus pyralis]